MRAVDATVCVLLDETATEADVETVIENLDRGFDEDLRKAKRRVVFHARIVEVDRNAEVTEADERFNRGTTP